MKNSPRRVASQRLFENARRIIVWSVVWVGCAPTPHGTTPSGVRVDSNAPLRSEPTGSMPIGHAADTSSQGTPHGRGGTTRLAKILHEIEGTEVPFSYNAAPGHPGLVRLVRQLEALLTDHPADPAAHLQLGRLLLTLGEAQRALKSLTIAVAAASAGAESHSSFAIALLATGQPHEALPHFEKAVQLEPSRAERLTNLGAAYMMCGRATEAIPWYKRAVELSPEVPRAQGDLGTALLALNQPNAALPHLLRARALAPERATFATNLGHAYLLLGRYSESEAMHRAAILLDSSLGTAWLNLGTTLAGQLRLDEAEQAIQKAAQLDPGDPRPARQRQDLLELKLRQAPQTPQNREIN